MTLGPAGPAPSPGDDPGPAPRFPIEAAEALSLVADDVRAVFRPGDAWEDWLARMVAVTATRAGESPRAERAMREHGMFRAARCWEEDRKRAAEDRAAGLA